MANFEEQYIRLLEKHMQVSGWRDNRTGVPTKSTFGNHFTVDLTDGKFPLLTTKKINVQTVLKELLWFISGSTDAKVLQEQGCHIWDANSSREFLDKRGLLNNVEGDLGPVYGFQWRHHGAPYRGAHADYRDQGVDQLQKAIDGIKKNPFDRRLLVVSWDVWSLHQMALPPCHYAFQFYVSNDEQYLSMLVNMRSSDLGLGLPFNVPSYAALLYMVCKLTGKKPKELQFCLGDTHIYQNHVEQLAEQLSRDPRPAPTLTLNPDKEYEVLEDFKLEDFQLEGYDPHLFLKMEMAQ